MEKKKKSVKNLNIDKTKLILIVSVALVVILFVLLLVAQNYKDFTSVQLRKNKNTIFSVTDLKVNDLEYGATEKQVKKAFGTPTKTKEKTMNNYKYKVLYFKGLTATMRENYDDFMLVKVEITSRKYIVSRDIKVGTKIKKATKKYYVDNKTGKYLYGNYSINAVSEAEVSNAVYVGLRTNKQISYIYRDPIDGNNKTYIAQLILDYKHGKVKKITWSYDFL